MGWKSVLGKIGKIGLAAAPFALAPFTGGSSLLGAGSLLSKAATLGSKLAPVLGAAAGSRSESQRAEDTANIGRDRLGPDRYESGLKAPGTRLKTAIGASKAANFKPVTAGWGGPGSGLGGQTVKFSGGYANPDMISPEARKLAEDTIHQQFLEGMGGKGGPPVITSATGGGVLDDVLGGSSTAAAILGALNTRDEDQPPIRKPVTSAPVSPWSRVRF